MARARNIKPGFFTNPELAECSPYARLLFIGLWLLADREGRLHDRPKHIKVQIFPCDDVDVDALLGDLNSRGFVIRYEALGNRYVWLPTFTRHQNPHRNEVPSEIPAFEPNRAKDGVAPERSVQITSAPAESISISPFLNPESISPLPSSAVASECEWQLDEKFLLVVQEYQGANAERVDVEDAWKIWRKKHLHVDASVILSALRAFAKSDDWKREKGRFVPALPRVLESGMWRHPPKLKEEPKWEEWVA